MTATDRRTLHACASVFFTMVFWAGSGLLTSSLLTAQAPAAAQQPATPAVPAVPPAPEPRQDSNAPSDDWHDRYDRPGVHVSMHRGDRVRIGGSVVIESGERVDDVVAVFGDVVVKGEVRGEVVAVLGSVWVEDGASVRGDVAAIGGTIQAAPTARIYGRANQVTIGWPGMVTGEPWQGGHFRFAHGEPWRWMANVVFVGTSVRIAVTLVLALLIALVAGDALRRQVQTINSRPGETFITGVGAELLLPVAFVGLGVTLLISIIGIPLLPLLPLLMIVVALAWVVGFAAATAALGRGVLRTLGASEPSMVLSVLVGAIPVFLLTVISRAVWVSSGAFPGWSIGVALGGALVEWTVWTFGLGTLALTWMRRQGPSASVIAPVAPAGPPATPPVPVGV